MNFIILASSLILIYVVTVSVKKGKKMQENAEQNFWAKEYKSNFVRKKSLEALNYISIPEEILALQPAQPTSQILSYLQDLKDLSALKIVNLTGISNTDLKLTYGTANITLLSEYDAHYTQMVTILQKLAEKLADSGDTENAIRVLEYAVSTGSDVSKSYYLLSELYTQVGTPEKIHSLIQQAEGIRSIMKSTILQHLQTACQ